MNPKKAKDLLPELSEKLNLPDQLLRDLTDFYWDENRRDLTSLEHLHVIVPHLGTFSIKGDKTLQNAVDKIDRYLQGRKPPTAAINARRMSTLEDRDKLETLKIKYWQEKTRKSDNKKLRNEIRETKTAMEGQETNPSGTVEPGNTQEEKTTD